MPRIVLSLVAALAFTTAALVPTRAAADAPPPDRFTPCEGHQAGDACYQAGCTCVTVTAGCPGGAASCLSCESASAWCGPVNYHPSDPGGCSTAAPAGFAAVGIAALALLFRRRRRR